MSSTILSPESDINASRVRLVITVPSVMISITTITVILRFTVKWKRNLSLGGDDWLILGASVCCLLTGSLYGDTHFFE